MEAFYLQDVSFSYPDAPVPALSHISLAINPGEFVLLCGRSGCGKTTLLRQLKPSLAPHGGKQGKIHFFGRPLEALPPRDQAARIGFVLQNPDRQIVTDRVWHELAFGMENLGLAPETIRLRSAEMSAFFGMDAWYHREVSHLSGGQKQLLSLAAVLALQPDVLLLDEPTAQLDPIAAAELLRAVKRVQEELSVTVLLSEHRLEECLPLCDRVVVLEAGRVAADAPPRKMGEVLHRLDHPMAAAMPAPVQVAAALGEGKEETPLTVREGRCFLHETLGEPPAVRRLPARLAEEPGESILTAKDVWFRYKKDAPDVLCGLDFTLRRGELSCLLGGNGAGKSTALALLSGQYRAQRGKIKLFGKPLSQYRERELFQRNLCVVPQDPQTLFVNPTVREDLLELFDGGGLSRKEREQRVQTVAETVELTDVLDRHPYDLSGGEQQRAALAKALLLEPRVLFLDEPTKGLDSFFKERLGKLLLSLTGKGLTVLLVSHDVEFCARWASRCALLFDGVVAAQGAPRAFFSGNSFYTTAANRMSRGIFEDAVTSEDVIALCRANRDKR